MQLGITRITYFNTNKEEEEEEEKHRRLLRVLRFGILEISVTLFSSPAQLLFNLIILNIQAYFVVKN